MSNEATALNLYKANIELQLRITRLVQESGHRWLESVQQSSTESINATTAELESVLHSANWQALATLPAESFWRLFQGGAGDAQALQQLAIRNQTAFTSGLQEVLQSWQGSVAKAVGNAEGARPLQDVFRQWRALWAHGAAAGQSPNQGRKEGKGAVA